MKTLRSIKRFLGRVHGDERGGVSLETILIISAIALPILIWLIKYGWPKIRNYFDKGIIDLQNTTDRTTSGQ
jgi:hypothetical protein